MQLTILGCWAPYQRADGACPGYLLQAGSTNLLLDCGHGVVGKLQKHLDFRQLTAVVISHLHPDHYMDLFSLRHAIGGAKRDGSRLASLDVWLPSAPTSARERINSTQDAFQLNNLETLQQNAQGWLEGQIGDCKLQYLLADHPLPCYAIAIEHAGKRIVYTADTGWLDPLLPFIRGADLLLCEASLQDVEAFRGIAGHLSARQAGDLARQTGAKQLVLTHFWPEHNLAISKREAQEAYSAPVILAEDGLTVRV